MANRLADMHEIAPQLTEAVAKRITSTDLHDKALQDLGAFVHRTVVEDEHTYAVRIDDGALLDAAEQIEHARAHLTADGQRQLARDPRLRARAARRRARHARRPRQDQGAQDPRSPRDTRDRARNGRYAFVHERGQDFAAGIWVVDPAFMLDLAHEHLGERRHQSAREEAFFAGARLDDDELRDRPPGRPRTAQAHRPRHAEATRSNLGLGHDIRAGLMDPTRQPAPCAQAIVCHLLVRHYRELIAYGAGWTDPERQHPVGDTGRHEPRQPTRSSTPNSSARSPTPTRCAASPSSLPAGQPHSCSTPRRHPHQGARLRAHDRKLRDALPGGEPRCAPPCGSSCGRCSRPASPRSTVTLRADEAAETTVDLDQPTARHPTSPTSTSTSRNRAASPSRRPRPPPQAPGREAHALDPHPPFRQ